MTKMTKLIKVSDNTHEWIMDNKNSKEASADQVIQKLIKNSTK